MAPVNLIYPEVFEIQQIEQDLLPTLTESNPIFEIMPVVEVNATRLRWVQGDAYSGLATLRGLDGQPGNVRPVGGDEFEARPGVYGDFATIDEEEMTERGQFGTFGAPVDITDLVMQRQEQLLTRRLNRIAWLGWQLVTKGTYNVLSRNGARHTDTYTLQTYNASAWGTAASATPLVDFRGAQLLSRGHSVSFGAGATAWMNRATANTLLANTNAADLGGKRTSGLANILSMAEVNNVLNGEDLPAIRIWDGGYLDDAGNFQLDIADNIVAIVGQRAGNARILDFAYTRNANNPNSASGPYTFVKDRRGETVPPTVEVHDGFNGGLRVYHPTAIILMDVS
jgi:hypothetical protein